MLAWLEQFLVRYPELAMAPWPRVLTIAVLVNLAFALSTAAQSHTSLGPGLNETLASERPASWSRLGDRLNRRKACRQQAAERGLSGRMARRFTRLCLSGQPVPKPIPRSP
jgi:hypothetical protein